MSSRAGSANNAHGSEILSFAVICKQIEIICKQSENSDTAEELPIFSSCCDNVPFQNTDNPTERKTQCDDC